MTQAVYVSPFEFDLNIAADSHGTKCSVVYSAWFYFGTDGFLANKSYTFNVKSTGKQVFFRDCRASCTKKDSFLSSDAYLASPSGVGSHRVASTLTTKSGV